MTFLTQCPNCGKSFRVNNNHLGRKGQCAACEYIFVVKPVSESHQQPTQSGLESSNNEATETVASESEKSLKAYSLRTIIGVGVANLLFGMTLGAGGLAFLSKRNLWSDGPSKPLITAPLAVPKPKESDPIRPDIVARAPAAAKPKKVPELFKTQTLNYVKAAGKLSSLATQGVNISEFRDQLATVRAELDLLEQTWPADLERDTMKQFNDSVIAYDLSLQLWRGEIGKYDPPVEPNINRWQDYIEFAGSNLIVKTHPPDFIVERYRGKKYLPFDENIRILMSIGSERFRQGRDAILRVIE